MPFFKEKIQSGEPIPLTHPDMTRFIISVDQAADLVMKALLYNMGGEVMIPNLPSVKIKDLIEAIKTIMDANNDIVEVGIRPGEKIHEILINEYEIPHTFQYEDTFIISSLIEKFQRRIDKPLYQLQGELVDHNIMIEYSSKDYLLTNNALLEYLRNLNLL